MLKKITSAWLKAKNFGEAGIEYFIELKESEPMALLEKLIDIHNFDCAKNLIEIVMTPAQYLEYARFVARQMLSLYCKCDEDREPQGVYHAKKYMTLLTTEIDVTTYSKARDVIDYASSTFWKIVHANITMTEVYYNKMKSILRYGLEILRSQNNA